ncbi:GmrSD restriction endonuclease domain-containing protein [Streptomyces umbrinus]|uniref:GmrSD restriction endonuclease domain-containing protein n=1 Tax=Streptomyces umbrinus TaxID=67370 RepID=UPI003C2CC1CE
MATDEIKSQGFNLKELFRDVSYEIDYYQRDYTWGEEEVRTLLRDLCTSFRQWGSDPALLRRPGNAPQYFLGPFVYYEQSRNRRCLVDGQQRFVTLHLIFLQLRARAQDLGYTRPVDRLNRTITTDGHHFSVGISDHEPVLRAISQGRTYEPGAGDSLSRRNLWARSQQIAALLAEELDSERLDRFIDWLLDRVVLVGIRAVNQDHGYRMFETMNDRGARLTAVDLLKSYLLSNVGSREDELNTNWQEMLRELATDREDAGAPARFIKAALLARHVRPRDADDRRQIDNNLNVWVRKNTDHLGLHPDRPENFMRFVTSLLDTARLFRPLLAASRELKQKDDRLEAVFFNERNGLQAQAVAMLSAIRPDDLPADAKEKGRLVANFIDRWYVLRVLQDLSVQTSDVADLVHDTLVPRLRACRNVSDVAAFLGGLAAQDADPNAEATTFGLRGNNSHQVRYVLARTTGFVEEECERPGSILAYLDHKQFHIEHLWAKHHSRVEVEIPDPVVFRTRRNQLGGLGLLPGRENSSFNDLPLTQKIPLYRRHNTLLGILAADFDLRNPPLRAFIKTHHLDALLRPFGPMEAMTKVVKTRQSLYLRLCALIWHPERLGLHLPTPETDLHPPQDAKQTAPQPHASAPRAARRRTTDVAKMLDAGVLKPGTPIVLTYRSVDHWATVDADGGIVLKATGGTAYGRVDEAGAVVRGTKTCQGMNEWRIEDQQGVRVSLRTLRDQAQASGLLGRIRR